MGVRRGGNAVRAQLAERLLASIAFGSYEQAGTWTCGLRARRGVERRREVLWQCCERRLELEIGYRMQDDIKSRGVEILSKLSSSSVGGQTGGLPTC